MVDNEVQSISMIGYAIAAVASVAKGVIVGRRVLLLVSIALCLGLGGRFLSGGAFGEVDLKLHVLFTDASTEPASSTNYLSLSFGVGF